MRILLIEDDDKMPDLIELTLATEGWVCDKVPIGNKGIKLGRAWDYDLIILDLMLPDISGLEVLLRLRAVKIKTPVLILSGIVTVDQKVISLYSGADDYLTKPFNGEELIARIKAIIRRSKGHSESVVRFDKVSVNLDTRQVEIAGEKIHLTNKEYAILELLVLRRGTVIPKEKLLEHLYPNNNKSEETKMKIIDVFMCKLRKKIAQAAGGEGYITTVWGRGYMLPDIDNNVVNAEEVKAAGG